MLPNKTFKSQNPTVFFDLFQKKNWSTWWPMFKGWYTHSVPIHHGSATSTRLHKILSIGLCTQASEIQITRVKAIPQCLYFFQEKNQVTFVSPHMEFPMSCNHDTKLVLKPVLARPNMGVWEFLHGMMMIYPDPSISSWTSRRACFRRKVGLWTLTQMISGYTWLMRLLPQIQPGSLNNSVSELMEKLICSFLVTYYSNWSYRNDFGGIICVGHHSQASIPV